MGALQVQAKVSVSGPLADGTAPDVIHTWMDGVKQEIADLGMAELRGFAMDKTGRATGEYQREINKTTVSFNDVKLAGGWPSAVYGPWLEGSSKRNRSTRFKGYKLWRITARRIQERTPEIIQKHMPELLRRLGGGV